jgi:hypothetical protein
LNLQKDIINNVKELKNDMLENMRMMTENMELFEEMLHKQKKKVMKIEDTMVSNAESLTKEVSIVSEKCDMLIENVEDNNRRFRNNIKQLNLDFDINTRFIVFGDTGAFTNKYSINKNILTNISQLSEFINTRLPKFYLHSLKYFTNLKDLDLKYLYLLFVNMVDNDDNIIINNKRETTISGGNKRREEEYYNQKTFAVLLQEEGEQLINMINYIRNIRPDMKLLWNNEIIE